MHSIRARRLIVVGTIIALAIVGLTLIMGDIKASASEEPCVPQDAWTETIEHPAVTHEEQVFAYWQRYSWTGGPHREDDPPAFPSDDWQPNVQGDPHGIGVEGAYFRSHGNSGNGDWFYLESVETTVVVVDQEAWVETIEHPAVICPELPTSEPTTPTQEPTTGTPTSEPTTGVETPAPTETPTEATPSEAPQPPKKGPKPVKKDVRLTECVNGTWVTTLDGEVISESGTCDRSTVTQITAVPVQEEGL